MDKSPVYTTSKAEQDKNVKPGSCQVAGGPFSVRSYPGLSATALKADLDKDLALWYELRSINDNGSSRLLLNDALAALVKHFDYTQSTAYRLLQAGDGKLWDIKRPPLVTHDALYKSRRKRRLPFWTGYLSEGQANNSTKTPSPVIQIKGLREVAEYLGTYPGRAVEIRASDFRGRQAKTAWLYASFFKPDGVRAKPISRDSIKAATGVLIRQQRRYDKAAGIKRVANFAFQQDGQGKLTPIRHLVDGKSRQWLKDRRLGNTYHSRALQAPRGMTKRVNAELGHRSFNSGEASCVSNKRFFFSARSLVRSPERANEAFILVNKRDRIVRGRMEWCMT
jgi:hypothetical protein